MLNFDGDLGIAHRSLAITLPERYISFITRDVVLLRIDNSYSREPPTMGGPMRRLIPIVILSLIVVSPAFAESPKWGDKNTLKGIKAVCVRADKVGGDAAQASFYGVTSESLEARVERKLKEVGISVTPHDMCMRMPDGPYLQVTANVLIWPTLETNFLYLVDLDYIQIIILGRDNSTKALVPTWSSSRVAITPKNSLGADVMNAVDSQVKKFTEDYFAVNR
jgi:hypothetical protein